ncbi:hypothetical protein GJ744_010009 [Endocarpon pusillum]|uniref:Uncharacterized protein n=1 Tax=Endocarpon pusillum TaxID=364733 RepID=A0A8H7AML1_9EURO|nr:hypothetical protein GJ744_010009 [Endocarpon pusillum]
MSGAEGQVAPILTVADPLVVDEERFVEYLNRNSDAGGGCDIWGLVGVRSLTKRERRELERKLRREGSQ